MDRSVAGCTNLLSGSSQKVPGLMTSPGLHDLPVSAWVLPGFWRGSEPSSHSPCACVWGKATPLRDEAVDDGWREE